MERWQTPGYAQILQVRACDGTVTVQFADGGWVQIDGSRLLPPEVHDPAWSAITVDEYGDFLIVPTAGDPVDIPADRIRIVTDPAFAEHRARRARAEARMIGRRIRTLRERRGLTAKEVARRAGITPMSISRIELGRHEVILSTLARILAAMGCSFHDLKAAPVDAVDAVDPVREHANATSDTAAGEHSLPGKTAGTGR